MMKYFSPIYKPGKNLRPPDLYEYFVDNSWFKAADLENQKITETLQGSHQADAASSLRGFLYRGSRG
jgi:hypothetical protein